MTINPNWNRSVKEIKIKGKTLLLDMIMIIDEKSSLRMDGLLADEYVSLIPDKTTRDWYWFENPFFNFKRTTTKLEYKKCMHNMRVEQRELQIHLDI